jgi:fatty acid elongase 2/fatty acid elongase 3
VFVYFASYTYFTSTYFPWMPNHGKCAGEEFAAFAGMGILSSYLLLFISFYVATYKKDGKRPTGRKAARSLKDAEVPDIAALTHGKIVPEKKNGHANGSNGHAVSSATPGRPSTRSRKA